MPLSSPTKGARAQRAGYARGREGRQDCVGVIRESLLRLSGLATARRLQR